jgi:hypothetical protein
MHLVGYLYENFFLFACKCCAVADSTTCKRPVPHYLASRVNKAVKGKDKSYSNNAQYEQLSVKTKKKNDWSRAI